MSDSGPEFPVNAGQRQHGRFVPGVSGNPTGKPAGARHRTTIAALSMLDKEAVALVRKTVELALAGDVGALRLCLDKIIPPRRELPIRKRLPPLSSPADGPKVLADIMAAVTGGALTAGEGSALAAIVKSYLDANEVAELAERITALEERAAAASLPMRSSGPRNGVRV